MSRKVRVGIDVGGTHTKAVAIDNETYKIIGKSQILTTHDAKEGVAKGVVDCFKQCLSENHIQPENVVFIAHSTTQATNALLEGDVADVGILGIGNGLLGRTFVKAQTKLKPIPLVTGRFIKTINDYMDSQKADENMAIDKIRELKKKGARVIVVSEIFGVDDNYFEELIGGLSGKENISITRASDITKMYGLTTRTRTAAINASILPKMLDTANSTERGVKEIGITSPLMIMRGDGGVMNADELRKRPILSMLSGPTASVMGALMYLRASVGIYFEVGGTSTNIGVIKNGRPTIKYSKLGGYRTYVNALDVRVLGVAGGSMVRANHNKIVDVGPRSAHIAGMSYAAFTDPKDIVNPEIEFIAPKAGDPSDYVVVKCSNGKRMTITNSCAANALGLVKDEYYAKGNRESCRKAMQPLADYLGLSIDETAVQILKKSSEKLIPVVRELVDEYKLDEDQSVLVGCGGGAAALIPFMSQEMNIKYKIPENADVISSIGVALAMVREVVERQIPNATAADISSIRQEAIEAAINAGAAPSEIETVVEIDSQTQKVRVIASGATEARATDMSLVCDDGEAVKIAAESIGMPEKELKLEGSTGIMRVITAQNKEKNKTPVRIVDNKGFVRLQISDGKVVNNIVSQAANGVKELWNKLAVYKGDMTIHPDIFIAVGGRIVEIVNIPNYDQAKGIIDSEMAGLDGSQPIVMVGVKGV